MSIELSQQLHMKRYSPKISDMKKLPTFILLLGFMMFLTSCSVDEDLLPLTGEWQLLYTSGGITGGQFEVDKNIRLSIDGNELEMYEEDSIILKAKMKISEGEYYKTISFDKKFSNEDGTFQLGITKELRYDVSESTLIFSDECADCFSYHFMKS
jgi:hypothetical protein